MEEPLQGLFGSKPGVRDARSINKVAKARTFVLNGGMNNDPAGVVLEPRYAAALGAAVFSFASLEWNAVQCCERLEPGSIEGLEDRTAGRVADTLLHLIKRIDSSAKQRELQSAAEDFKFLVGTRNNLVHAKPGIGAEGHQRLFRHGDQWTVEELEGVADAFARCAALFVRASAG